MTQKKTTNRHSQKTTFALLLATFGADRHHMRTSANPESSWEKNGIPGIPARACNPQWNTLTWGSIYTVDQLQIDLDIDIDG